MENKIIETIVADPNSITLLAIIAVFNSSAIIWLIYNQLTKFVSKKYLDDETDSIQKSLHESVKEYRKHINKQFDDFKEWMKWAMDKTQ